MTWREAEVKAGRTLIRHWRIPSVGAVVALVAASAGPLWTIPFIAFYAGHYGYALLKRVG
jgi:hypothetical protein